MVPFVCERRSGRRSCSAATVSTFDTSVEGAPLSPFLAIYGSRVGTVRLRVLRIGVSGFVNDGFLPDAGLVTIRCVKYSSVATGGIDQTLTPVAIDSRHGRPTTSLCAVLTGAVVPTTVGTLGTARVLSRSADLVSALTPSPALVFDFSSERGGVLLRSSREGVGVALESSDLLVSQVMTCSAWIDWVEDF